VKRLQIRCNIRSMDKTGIVLSVLTIIAVIIGPVAALWVQRILDEGRDAKNRKAWVFKTLMSYRATPLSPHFVQALNLIDVEFDGKNEKEKAVRGAWKLLLDHFSEISEKLDSAAGDTKALAEALTAEKTSSLTANLLLKMGTCQGYKDFDEVYLKKGAYYPRGLGYVEQEQHAVRRGILKVLSGNGRIPVGIFQDTFPDIILRPEPPAKELPATAESVKKLSG
jgi:hypothetical protein